MLRENSAHLRHGTQIANKSLHTDGLPESVMDCDSFYQAGWDLHRMQQGSRLLKM